MKHLMLLCLLWGLTCPAAYGQSDWEQAFQEWLTVEDNDGEYGEEAMTHLQDMADNKLNLNQLTREELEELPFLTAQQVEGLMAYLERYRPVRSLSELQMVTALDRQTRRMLSFFVYAGPEKPGNVWPSLADVHKQGRHTVMATAKVPLYERRGDKNGYLGYPLRHDVRYQFAYHNRIKAGITAAQDAGEPFLANKNTLGYDHYSYYFHLRDMGRLEELNLGMYRVQMGMGLVVNTGFHLGKVASLQSMGHSVHTLAAHASRSADGYMQGAAATVRVHPRWRLTALASYRPVDATLNNNGSVRTLVSGGYHRTKSELARKNNTQQTDVGLRLAYRPAVAKARKGIPTLGVNMLFTHFDRPLQPAVSTSSQQYRLYAPTGYSFFNASIDYGITNSRLAFAGETAVNADGALATLNTLSLRLNDEVSLMALHRYYARDYTAIRARSFAEGASTQNEHGLYLGASWKPSRRLQLQAYADYAYFPWRRYMVSTSSEAFDAMLLARVYINRCTLDGRYRFHIRQRDNAAKTLLQNSYDHRSRLRLTLPLITPSLSLLTQADAAVVSQGGVASRGLMLSQQAVAAYGRWQCALALSWFHTDGYDSRLYLYERSVAYDFSFPAYYGHGIRYALLARYDCSSRLRATIKIGTTDYFDRAVISSALQQIDRSSQTDLLFQLRYKL